jgi:hypothetical protein
MRKLIFFLGVFFPVMAYAEENPFALATEKTKELTDYLTGGGLLVAICTLVIIVASVALAFNKLQIVWWIRIVAAAIIIGSAGAISGFLFG